MVAVSWLAPLPTVIVWPTVKPTVAATGMTVSTCVAALERVLPAVPTRDDGIFHGRAHTDHHRLTGGKVGHACHLDVVGAGGRAFRQAGGRLDHKIGAEAVGVRPVGEAADAAVGRARGRSGSATAGALGPEPAPGITAMQPPWCCTPSSVASSGLVMAPLALELLCCEP